MTVNGLSHITLISSDLNRLEEILINVLDARKVYDSGEEQFSLSEERFYLIGNQNSVDETENLWLVAMKGNPKLDRDYHHIAFAIDEDEIIKTLKKMEYFEDSISQNNIIGIYRTSMPWKAGNA